MMEQKADMLLRNFLFPLLLGKELRIAPRDTATVVRVPWIASFVLHGLAVA